jgi:hypothetical protein
MELSQAKIVGDDTSIRVLSGRITEIFKDRRGSDLAPIRFGSAAQRRKLPQDLEKLVGTGRLWVVRGIFEILESQTKNWKPSAIHLVTDGMQMRIVRLQSTTSAATTRLDVKALKINPNAKTWNFSALFEPTSEQLDRLIQSLPNTNQNAQSW